MKKVLTILTAVIITATVWAQSPEKMSYQAVVRDASDNLVTNTNIGIQVSIIQSSATGTSVYVERHFPTTNDNGLVTLEIGTGTVVSGNFSTIDWANDIYFIKTEIDLAGGANYTISSTNQLLSVPYALHAKTAESITGGINETDPTFNAWDKSYNDLTNTPNITDTITAVLDTTTQFVRTELDADPTNEIQTISRTGLTVTLSNGGGTYQDSVNVYTAGTGIDITNNVIKTVKPKFYLGQDTLGGIVYHIYLDANEEQHGLIVSKTETTAKWQNTGVTTNATRSWDGNYNMNLMSDSPAKDWITTNFTSEWYLPSIDELSFLWHSRYYVNKALNGTSGTLLSNTALYWSSTEYNVTYAFYFYFYNGTSHHNYKTNTYSVRAVRAF